MNLPFGLNEAGGHHRAEDLVPPNNRLVHEDVWQVLGNDVRNYIDSDNVDVLLFERILLDEPPPSFETRSPRACLWCRQLYL